MKKILFLIVALSATLNMNANAPAVSVGAAKPVVLVDEPTTAQEWYNKLRQTIMTVEANLSKLNDSDAKTQLTIAYNNANELYLAGCDPEKLEEYKSAYNALWRAYQDAIKVDVDVQLSELGSAIGNAETTRDEVLVGTGYQTQLQGYIDAAITTKDQYFDKSEFAISDISYLKGYITSFNSNVQDVIDNDIANERNMLNVTIGIAEVRLSGIEGESSIIAATLGAAIAEAKPIAEDLTSTAHKLSEAHTAIYKADQDCQDKFDAFKTAKLELYNTIKAAVAFCVKIKHTPISSILYQSITDAQGVYDGAINKTTEELTIEKGKLEAAQTIASGAEAVAVDIDVWIANAMHALSNIPDEETEIREQIQGAIDDAKEALKTKSAKVDLDSALETLKDKTEEYIEADITKAGEDLKVQIDDADDKLENVIAYDEFYSQLLDAKDVADRVYNKSNHTAEEIIAATETLESAISEIVDNDGQKAANELNSKLEDANSKLQEVNGENITLAGDLETKISEAQSLVSEGTARARKAAADALTLAIKAADNAYKMFLANKKALEDEKAAAESTLTNNIAGTHTGIKTALSSAISDADGVLGTETIKTKTNAEILQAVDALKNAHQGAKDAEVQALVLDEKISLAEEALTKIGYSADYEGLNLAINSAKELYDNPLKIAIDYYNAWNNLDIAMTAYVADDIEQGRIALGKAIDSADRALTDTLVNGPYLTNVTNAKSEAETVKRDATDRATLDTATSDLLSAVHDAVVADLGAEKEILLAAVNDAESALKPYQDMARKVTTTDDARNAFNVAVVNPFSSLISTADKVRKNTKSTSKQMDAQVTILSEGKREMVAAYDNLYNSEKQNFFDTYLKERADAAKVNKENNVIVGLHNSAWQKGIALNERLNGENPEVVTYADIINVRIPMDKECDDLNNEFSQWQTYCSNLTSLKDNAQMWKDNLKEEDPEAPIGTALQVAIDAADEIVVADKNATEMETAYCRLNDAFEIAKSDYNTQYWDFTDTNSDIKAGTYDPQHARYTRSVSTTTTEENYATFCLPMTITVDDQFLKVYTPENFAILNGTTLKLFLTEVAQGKEIKAGTPFFAQLACKGKLVLKNNAELTVDGTSSPNANKRINVYQQSGESSFVTRDNDIKVYWCGTFQEVPKPELSNKWAFSPNGTFGPRGSIPAFRAYIQQNIDVGTSNAKVIDAIEVDFGDGSETTGIRSIMMGSSDGSQIFSIDGKNMGNDMNSLNKGVYIINGKKVLK